MKPLYLALGTGIVGGLLLFTFFPLSPASNQLAAVAVTTPAISFTQTTYEGQEGTKVRITVKLDDPVTKTTRIKLRVASGTARSGTDFVGTSPTLTFYKGGLQSKTITVSLKNDSVQENPETIFVSFVSIDGKTISSQVSPKATIMIIDKDALVGFSVAPTSTNSTVTCPTPNYKGTPLTNVKRVTWNEWNNEATIHRDTGLSTHSEDFPRLFNVKHSVRMSAKQYASIEFVAHSITQTGVSYGVGVNGLIDGASATFSYGNPIFSISECLGDFDASRLDPASLNPTIAPAPGVRRCMGGPGEIIDVRWTIDPNIDPQACLLIPGKKYYFNITYGRSTTLPDGLLGEPWCATGDNGSGQPLSGICTFEVWSRGF